MDEDSNEVIEKIENVNEPTSASWGLQEISRNCSLLKIRPGLKTHSWCKKKSTRLTDTPEKVALLSELEKKLNKKEDKKETKGNLLLNSIKILIEKI